MYTIYNTRLYICLEALCTYRTPQTWRDVRENGSSDGIFTGMLLRSAATVYGFYEAGAHITMAPVNHKQRTYLLLGSLIFGKVKHKR